MHSFKPKYLSKGFFGISFGRLKKILLTDYLFWIMWILISLITLFIILWLPNWSLLMNVMSSSLSFSAKLDFLSTTPQFLTSSYPLFESVMLVVVVILQGLNIALVIRLWRKNKKANATSVASGGIATSVAIASTGCAACGTSLIYPLVGSLGASAVGMTSLISGALMIIASVVLVYSIHYLLMISFDSEIATSD